MVKQRKFQELDSLRALAVISVLLLHFGTAFLEYNMNFDYAFIGTHEFLRGLQLIIGAKGVYLFFSLSGFLIVYLLKKKGFSDFNYFQYLKRRFWRLHPPYIAALTGFLIVHFLVNDYSLSLLFKSFAASFFYIHDIVFYKWSYILPVAWSLEIEIQYYLVAPLIVFISYKLNNIFLIIGFYFVFLLLFLNFNPFDFRNVAMYIKYFVPGMVVGELYFSGKLFLKRSIIFDLVFISIFALFISSKPSNWDCIYLFLIFTSLFNLKYLQFIMLNRYLNFLGQISFSVYLLHYPMFHLLMKLFTNKLTFFQNYTADYIFQALIFIPITIVLIYPFYFVCEQPFINRVSFRDNIYQMVKNLNNRLKARFQ